MPDNILLIVFGSLTAVGLLFGGLGLALAVRSARKPDGELKMAFWSFVALAGLTFSGMCTAYFLLPILANHLFR
jgi:hypothetical protein